MNINFFFNEAITTLWFLTTLLFPGVTLIYAWLTGKVMWALFSIFVIWIKYLWRK